MVTKKFNLKLVFIPWRESSQNFYACNHSFSNSTDTSTQNYFKSKTQTIRDADVDDDLSHLNGSNHHKSSMNNNETVDKRESSSKDKFIDIQQPNQKRPLTKKDSIDLDCKDHLLLKCAKRF